MQNVTILTTHGRRQVVKVAPNKTLLEILEECCEKFKFDPDNFDLKHHNKLLDLTQMFRFSGLPNNAQLEMVESDGKRKVATEVVVCLQLEDGSRANGSFTSTDLLSHVIGTLCPDKDVFDKNPCIIYMRKEVYGHNIKNTTLKSLGLTGGRALLRLSLNKIEVEIKIQANISAPIPKKVKEMECEEVKPSRMQVEAAYLESIKTQEISEIKSPVAVEEIKKKDDAMDLDEIAFDGKRIGFPPVTKLPPAVQPKIEKMEESEESKAFKPEIKTLDERGTILFSLETAVTSSFELPDAFFDLTVSDVRKMYQDLRNNVSNYEDAPLMTKELRNLEESKKILNQLGLYKKCLLRIQFPDRYVLQSTFTPIETVKDIKDLVKKYLLEPEMDFFLFLTPPKKILTSEQNLLEAGVVPSALIHVGFNSETKFCGPYFKSELYSSLTSASGASFAISKTKNTDNNTEEVDEEYNVGAGPSNAGASSKQKPTNNFMPSKTCVSEAKLPKWFKTSK